MSKTDKTGSKQKPRSQAKVRPKKDDFAHAHKTNTHHEELVEQLATVVRCSDDAIFSIRMDGAINSWNPAAHRIFGYSAHEALEKNIKMLFFAEHQKQCDELLRQIGCGEHVPRHEALCLKRDHKPIHVALTLSPIQLRAHGRVSGASIIARDITDQIQSEDKLRKSEAFYHSLVENLPQFIFRKDLDLRITFANQRHCQMLGKPLPEVIGKTDYDFYPPEMASKFQYDDRQVILSGIPIETVEVNQPPGGKKIYVNVCKTPIRDSSGKIIGIQGIFWDITASREAEEALRQSEERYKTLLNSVTDYIYTVEFKSGKPVATRHGPGCLAVTGYAPEDYENADFLWYLMIHPDDRELVVQQLNNLLHGKTEPLEHRIIHRDSSVRWVRNTQVPRLDDAGNVIAYDGLISDITERKLAEEKLKQANVELSTNRDQLMRALEELNKSHEDLKAAQMLLIRAEKMETVGRLAAGVAHEVKNPLAILLSGIDYLKEAPITADDNVRIVIKDMREALRRADTVVRGLLDFAAAQELGMQPENLSEIIETPLSLMRHDLNRGGVVIKKEIADDLPCIDMDRNKIEQVFLNLFLNALHAMPQGGVLTIRTKTHRLSDSEVASDEGSRSADKPHAGDLVIIAEVDDTGTGIPEDKLSKVCEPFFTTKPTGKGTGLGLAVSKKILEMHGATISIGNRPEGGVRVRIIFKA